MTVIDPDGKGRHIRPAVRLITVITPAMITPPTINPSNTRSQWASPMQRNSMRTLLETLYTYGEQDAGEHCSESLCPKALDTK
ncbi:MAG: hypothetical protein IPM83_11815 [Ignavibacteria bacterium]|nr:hypothetical protein [Ignavibacteria bacterium]